MEGIQFVRENHLSTAEGCYLPRADLLGHIQSRLHEILFKHTELKQYVPHLMDVDLFISWDEDKFLLFVSPEKRAHLRAEIRDAIESQLRHEPTKISKSRIKRLRGVSRPQYRLRFGEIRVFYDVSKDAVEVLAIVAKSQSAAWLREAGESI
jgi:mRNA interferase RelE/StbE